MSSQADLNTRPAAAEAPVRRRRIADLLRSPFVGSMGIMTVAMGASLMLRMLTFAIVARGMGPHQFGAFATVAAVALVIGSFSGWGAEQLLLRRVGRAPGELPRAIATSLVFWALSAPPLVVLSLALVPLVVDSSIAWRIVLFVAISEIGLARVNSIAAACYLAVGRSGGNARLNVGFALARALAAVLWILAAPRHDALSWSSFYLTGSAIAAARSLWRIRRDLGWPEWKIAWHEWRDGFQFGLQTASYAAFDSTDKPVIALLSNLSTAGIYTAANRIAMAAAIPVQSMLYSAYVRFFQLGVQGPHSSARLAVRLLPLGVGLGMLGAVVTAVMAPLAPRLLGHSYLGTDAALLLLAPVPVFYAAYCLGLDVLVSTGHTALRTLAQIMMPPVNILLCWLLVPAAGVRGAALAALLSHASLAVVAWLMVAWLVRRSSSGNGDGILNRREARQR